VFRFQLPCAMPPMVFELEMQMSRFAVVAVVFEKSTIVMMATFAIVLSVMLIAMMPAIFSMPGPIMAMVTAAMAGMPSPVTALGKGTGGRSKCKKQAQA